jgi:hypothetical protein
MIFSVTRRPPWHAVAQRMRYTTTVVFNVMLHRLIYSRIHQPVKSLRHTSHQCITICGL